MKKHYEAVPVETQLPPKANDYYGVLAVGHSCPMMREWDGVKFNSPVQSEIITHWLREVGSSVSTEDITHDELIAELDDRRVAKAISEDAWYFCRKQSAEHLLEKYEIKPRITDKDKPLNTHNP